MPMKPVPLLESERDLPGKLFFKVAARIKARYNAIQPLLPFFFGLSRQYRGPAARAVCNGVRNNRDATVFGFIAAGFWAVIGNTPWHFRQDSKRLAREWKAPGSLCFQSAERPTVSA
jgi:hypothetical protein